MGKCNVQKRNNKTNNDDNKTSFKYILSDT